MARGLSDRGCIRLLLASLAALFAVGCGEASPPARSPASAEVLEIKSSGAYQRRGENEGLGEICKIDPAACPGVSMEKAANRPLRPEMYAMSGSAAIEPSLGVNVSY